MRAMICSLVSRSVSETLIVRSNGKTAVVHFVERFDVACIAKSQPSTRAAKSLASDFDLLGQRNFLLAGQQRNLRHLASGTSASDRR